MTWLLSLVTKNPLMLAWLAIGTFVAGLALGGTAAWTVQGIRLDKAHAEHARYVAESERNAAAAQRALLDQKARWLKEKEDAQKESEVRLAKVQADLTATTASAGKLRNTISTLRTRLATASQPAVIETASTLGELLGACEAEYRVVAEAAQRHASDVETLISAWPKITKGEHDGS